MQVLQVHRLVEQVLRAGPSMGQLLVLLTSEASEASREEPEVLRAGPSRGLPLVLQALEALEASGASREEPEGHRPWVA